MNLRQVVAVGYGGPEQLEVREHDPGSPGEGQALVEVRAVGVNAWDVKSYSGTVGDDPDKLPILLGGECAGVVLGGELPEGTEVIVHPVSGAYAVAFPASSTACTVKVYAVPGDRPVGTAVVPVVVAASPSWFRPKTSSSWMFPRARWCPWLRP